MFVHINYSYRNNAKTGVPYDTPETSTVVIPEDDREKKNYRMGSITTLRNSAYIKEKEYQEHLN